MWVAVRETLMPADTPTERRALLVRRITDSRRTGESAVFEAEGATVEYDDRVLRLEIGTDERDRLEELLSAYHVFKIKQPETRKADGDTVYLSAVTDAKHAADFVESLFREVYGAGKRYELRSHG